MLKVKLHLGCGNIKLPGYTNVDIQGYPSVDMICDLRYLPFGKNTIDLIYSCANIEHFGRHVFLDVLQGWYDVLKPGGCLRLSTADFHAVCLEYLENRKIETLFGLVVGGQKDKYDWHGMIFDFDYLKNTLHSLGFRNVRKYDWRYTVLGKNNIDDYSQAYLPHMNKDAGRLMMLNVEADK